MNLSSQNAHPRDAHIQFQEEGHKYTITTDLSSKYTSVTTWAHSHFPHFDADAVITSMMKGKNWNPTNKYWGLTPAQIKQQWSQNGKEVAAAGTQLHYRIECFMNNTVLPPRYTHQDLLNLTLEPSSQDAPEWRFFLEFVRDYPHFTPYRTEWLIYDEQVKISGSIDMVYENREDGTLSIYDWKRSKSIDKTNGWDKCAITDCISHLPDSNFWHYSLQLNIYKTIIERNYGKRVSSLYLVRLHPDHPRKTYELLKVPFLEQEMIDLFDLKKQTI
jgi:ATP-dependent exoDNAse (exonuclease V) beta subunit